MSGAIPLRRTVRNVTVKADFAEFKVALEDIVGWTGELRITGTEYEGSGIAFQPGDVLLGKLRPNLAKVWLADRPGAAVGDLLVLRPEGDLTGRALRDFLLQRNTIDYLAATAYGSKMPRTSWELVGGLSLSIAGPERQRAIADFLDRETAEIDAFVAESEKLITLLNERRAAVITQDLMSSESSEVPLWSLSNAPIENGIDEKGDPANPSDWPRFVRTTDISDSRTLDPLKKVTVDPRIAAGAMLQRGDLLLTRAGATVGKSYLHESDELACYAGYLVRLRPDLSKVHARYVSYWTESVHFSLQVQQGLVKSTIENFSASKYRAMRIPLPRLDEQIRITDLLDKKVSRIDMAVEAAREAIALAKERRQALISAAVTGKIDVRAAA